MVSGMSGIFISYRRSTSKHLARLIFNELRRHNYDVFLDVSTLDSGEFDRIILNQIAARPHFLLVLSNGALERCIHENDWLRKEIEEAIKLKRNIVPIFDEGFNLELEKQYLPKSVSSELSRFNGLPYSHFYSDAFIATINTRFLKTPVYDVIVTPTPVEDQPEVQRRIQEAENITAMNSDKEISSRRQEYKILPDPFEWITIPTGKVKIKIEFTKSTTRVSDVVQFQISKYPITNSQFQVFIDAGGYNNRSYWLEEGWVHRVESAWNKPEYWRKGSKLNHPVVGVSWFEAMAFCKWLSDLTGDIVTLPSEEQWQRASQGDTDREFTWGNLFISKYCTYNNNKHHIYSSSRNSTTTPVDHYRNKAESPFGTLVFDQ